MAETVVSHQQEAASVSDQVSFDDFGIKPWTINLALHLVDLAFAGGVAQAAEMMGAESLAVTDMPGHLRYEYSKMPAASS